MSDDAQRDDLGALANDLAAVFLQGFVEGGIHGAEDILRLSALERVKLISHELQKRKFFLITDYTPRILEEARAAKQSKRNREAVVAYSMLYEHRLNWIIVTLLNRGNHSRSVISGLIRLNMRDKSSWVLELVDVEPLEPEIRKKIQSISDCRNEYVHYKWAEVPDDRDDYLEAVLEGAECVIDALDRLEDIYLFGGKRNDLQSAILPQIKI